MKLHQLPNGSWVNLQLVTAIRALPTLLPSQSPTGTAHRARVAIHIEGGCIEILTANDNEHALQMANEYAQLVNQP